MRTLRFVAALVLITGAVLCGRALYIHAKAELAAVLIRQAWGRSLESGKPHRPWPWADTHPVARLQIPRLQYDEVVLEGATPRTLAFGPAHMLSGARFGEAGNLVVAGHRTSWFGPLEKIATGDTIRVEWFDVKGRLHEQSYTVDLIRVVQPEDVSLLIPTEEPALTLVTCYPFGLGPHSPERFIVRASPATKVVLRGKSPGEGADMVARSARVFGISLRPPKFPGGLFAQ